MTAGQRHDITQAVALIADISYDADDFRQVLADKPAKAVIPSRKNRKAPRDYDHRLYKERYLAQHGYSSRHG